MSDLINNPWFWSAVALIWVVAVVYGWALCVAAGRCNLFDDADEHITRHLGDAVDREGGKHGK